MSVPACPGCAAEGAVRFIRVPNDDIVAWQSRRRDGHFCGPSLAEIPDSSFQAGFVLGFALGIGVAVVVTAALNAWVVL